MLCSLLLRGVIGLTSGVLCTNLALLVGASEVSEVGAMAVSPAGSVIFAPPSVVAKTIML
jgi:hypothetical protein